MSDYKIFMGSWCFVFGFPKPASLDQVVKVLSAFGFDGIALGAGFTGHAAPDQFPTKQSRKELVDWISSYNLEIAGYAPDPYCMPWATGDADVLKAYEEYFASCLQMAADIGSSKIRVDPGSFGPLARGVDYNAVWDRVVTTFQKQAKMAADVGVTMLWEPETGQVFVKPSEIVKLLDDVGADNFMLDYDCGHAQAISVLGHNQIQPVETFEDGQLGYIKSLKGKIGSVGLNDSDNTTWMNLFGTHLGLGRGVLNFDEIVPALIDSGFRGPWWGCDAIPMSPDAWADAWTGIATMRELLDKYL
ncbi:MAG: sugar phosphate isomerase/epimerase [Caldilineales bacterium]|nr:sugar phosphate isomerase/epimerase [Caldilineales bacterium]